MVGIVDRVFPNTKSGQQAGLAFLLVGLVSCLVGIFFLVGHPMSTPDGKNAFAGLVMMAIFAAASVAQAAVLRLTNWEDHSK